MDKDTSLIKRYEIYIMKLKSTITEMEKTIHIQDEAIQTMEDLLEQKEEHISLLTSQLEKTTELARTMAQTLDSLS